MNALADAGAHVGEVIGTSRAVTVTREQIDLFARATGDFQWIHVDGERARRESPYGAPVAHGLLTLALIPGLLSDCLPRSSGLVVNYGLNRVRFPAPVLEGSTVRATATLVAYRAIEKGAQLTVGFDISVEGAARPSVVGEILLNYYR